MATGFFTEYGGQGLQDLENVFAPGSTGGATGFYSDYRGADLAAVFAPLSSGTRLSYNTGFVATDGRDLSDWFAANGTVIVNHRAYYNMVTAGLPARPGADGTWGYQSGVGGSLTYAGGDGDPGIEFFVESQAAGTSEYLTFFRFFGGGKPWGLLDSARIYFRTYNAANSAIWTGFANYASSSGEYQTIDDSGLHLYVGGAWEMEVRDYPF